MTSRTRLSRAVLLLAAGFGVASVLQAHAQTVWPDEDSDPAVADTAAADANDPDIRDLQLDWSQLNVDASTLTTRPEIGRASCRERV